jgi:hypothetical protein
MGVLAEEVVAPPHFARASLGAMCGARMEKTTQI